MGRPDPARCPRAHRRVHRRAAGAALHGPPGRAVHAPRPLARRQGQRAVVPALPLPEREGEQLVVHLLGGRVDQAVQAHISEWAQGYPLLVEELVTNLRDEAGCGRPRALDLAVESEEAAERRSRSVPTSIALLLARLDRLGPRGRAVIEPAAVVGQQFHLGDIEALQPEASAATSPPGSRSWSGST